jgi:hypothetical protein
LRNSSATAEDLWPRVIREMDQAAEQRWLTSPLAEWMETHHKEACEILRSPGMNWAKAAAAFAASKLKDNRLEATTPEIAREPWRRVEARRRAGLKLRKGKA